MRVRRVGAALLVVAFTGGAACTFGGLDGASGGTRTAPDAGHDVVAPAPTTSGDATPMVDANSDTCTAYPVALAADAGDDQRYQHCTSASATAADLLHDPANCGTCGHDCRGLDCDGGRCVPAVVTEPAIYRTHFGASTDGTNVYSLFDYAIDTANYLGWAVHDLDGNSDGGAVLGTTTDGLIGGTSIRNSVAASGTVYNAFSGAGGYGRVFQEVTTGSSGAIDVLPYTDAPANVPSSIALQGSTLLYAAPSLNQIGKLDLVDGGVTYFVEGRSAPDAVTVSPNGKVVAWTEAPPSTGLSLYLYTDRPYLVAEGLASISYLTADDDYVYFQQDGKVERVATTATTPVTPDVIFENDNLSYPFGLALSGDRLFWASAPTGETPATIFGRAKCAGPEIILTDSVLQPQQLMATSVSIFYLTQNQLFRLTP